MKINVPPNFVTLKMQLFSKDVKDIALKEHVFQNKKICL